MTVADINFPAVAFIAALSPETFLVMIPVRPTNGSLSLAALLRRGLPQEVENYLSKFFALKTGGGFR